MKNNPDIRWKQQLHNYEKALVTLESAVELAKNRKLTNLEKQGTIQGFEFTFELAWNLMKDFLEEQGITGIIGSKGAVRQAFSKDLIENGQVWMDIIESRNLSSHSYDETTAENLFEKITLVFYPQLKVFMEKMNSLEKQ